MKFLVDKMPESCKECPFIMCDNIPRKCMLKTFSDYSTNQPDETAKFNRIMINDCVDNWDCLETGDFVCVDIEGEICYGIIVGDKIHYMDGDFDFLKDCTPIGTLLIKKL